MRNKELCYYRLYEADGKTLLDDQETKMEVSDAINQLKSALDAMTDGQVVVKLYNKCPNKENAQEPGGMKTYIHRISMRENSISGPNQGNVYNNPNNFINELIATKEALVRAESNLILQKLEQKIDRLTSGDGSQTEIGQLIPILSGIFNKQPQPAMHHAPQAQPVAAPINGAPTAEELNTKGAELKAAFERWRMLDPNYIEAVKAIAHLAETDPSKYQMAKTYLGI